MRATWRTLPSWPYPDGDRKRTPWPATWTASLNKLEEEIARVGGADVVIAIVAAPDQFTLAGVPKANLKVLHRGVEVSFDHPGRGRLSFHTSAFEELQGNIHAIALGLFALRAIDRYGFSSGDEQYAGYQQITAGDTGPDPERGRRLAEEAGGIRLALKAHHPDRGGNARDFRDVEAYKKAVGA